MDVPPSPTDSSPPESVRLVLMRHAKSDHGDPGLSDFQRPLNDRGRRDSPLMADCLEQIDWIPDLVLCSAATRTRETLELMRSRWSQSIQSSDNKAFTPLVHFTDSLYLASPETIAKVVRMDNANHRSVMVLAHNPGISSLASSLSNQSLEMPTAAIACLSMDLPWNCLETSSQLTLDHFIRPKSLL